MLLHTVQAAVEPILAGGLEVHVQKFIHRAVEEPLAVQVIFAAGIDHPMDGQKLQDLLPGHVAAGVIEMVLPETIQLQPLPQPAAQPAVAEAPRPQQLHLREPDLEGVDRVGRNGAVVGEQGQLPGLLAGAVEDVQCLAPGRLLRVIDLTEIQDGSLGDPLAIGAAPGDASVFDDAEVAVVLSDLRPFCATGAWPPLLLRLRRRQAFRQFCQAVFDSEHVLLGMLVSRHDPIP